MHLLEDLLAGGPVVADGAWGTELQARGLEPGESPDLWNLTHPGEVREVARAYVAAGSRVILTNTFRANGIALAGHDLADRAAEINRAGVEISRQAAAGRALVFASMGPSGKMLAAGDVTPEELGGAFTAQAAALVAAGADALLLETFADLEEARIALAAAREAAPCPVLVSLVFDFGRAHDRTMTGATPEQAARELTAAGACAVGANCGRGPGAYVEICRRLAAASPLPVWIKPNAGLPELVDGRPVYRTTPEEFASYGPALVAAGARFLGGCCGTTPAFIRALRERISTCASN
ncbi:MAG TPA: homocysteine S-methyltransferase family protein [Bryobacteraceae bacterium]|nr:homocysteine S-methyltransferase family protein [Bryobacteraceae bacterium]